MGQIDEKSLARSCSEHNRKAEDELYTRYAGRIYALCLRYCDNQDDAKDLMQEAFIKALDNISSFTYRGEGSLYAWLRRIAVNMAINRIKSRKFKFIPIDMFKGNAVDDPPDESASLVPERVLLKMISELPEMKRSVFNMFCIDEYSHSEIARELGITEKGSASILSKAKTLLRERIREYIDKSRMR